MSSLLMLGADENVRVIAVRLKDPLAIARAQGGAVATAASYLVPATVSGEVYSKAAAQLDDALRAKGIDAEVRVMDLAGATPAPPSTRDLRAGLVLGVAATGATYIAWRLLLRRLLGVLL
jgi:hypothetical protein